MSEPFFPEEDEEEVSGRPSILGKRPGILSGQPQEVETEDPSGDPSRDFAVESGTRSILAKGRAASIARTPMTPSESSLNIPIDPRIDAMGLPRDGGIGVRDVANFVVGGEMGVIGAKWDIDGFSWNMENIANQWSNAPLWVNLLDTASLVGTAVFPLFRAARVATSVGKLARAGAGAKSLALATPGAAAGAAVGGILGGEGGAIAGGLLGGVLSARKLGKKSLSFLDETTNKTVDYFAKATDHSSEVGLLTEVGYLSDEIKDASGKVIRKATPDDFTNKNILEGRKWVEAKDRYRQIAEKAEAIKKGATTSMSKFEVARYQFDKLFMNTYMKTITSQQRSGGVQGEFHNRLSKIWDANKMGELFENMPDEEGGRRVIMHILAKKNPSLGATPVALKDANEVRWANLLETRESAAQTRRHAEGFISDAEFQNVGDFHFAAQRKKTSQPISAHGYRKVPVEVTTKGGKTALKMMDIPELESTTLLARKDTLPEVYKRLLDHPNLPEKQQLIVDPADMTYRGHVISEMLFENYRFVRDTALDPRYAINHNDIVTNYISKGRDIPKDYRSLSSLPDAVAERVRRMIEKKNVSHLGPKGELPWIHEAVFKDLVGNDGLFSQTQQAVNMLDILTTIYKTSKTGLNFPTHMTNMVGNLAFLSQAGWNPFAPRNVEGIRQMTGVFTKLVSERKVANLPMKDFLNKIALNPKVDLGTFKSGERVFNIKDEMTHPLVREILEESTFDSTEGYAHLKKLMDNVAEGKPLTKAVGNAYLGVKSGLELGGKVPWFEKMTQAYIGEDMVPKMAMYFDLLGQGLTREAALTKIARSMPMYGTVGSAIVQGRRMAFPWASFASESVRITKNNMMDYPIRMMPWLHLPGILQSTVSGLGGGPGFDETQEAKRGLPTYGQNPQTLVTKGQTGATIAGGASGTAVGGILGGVLGGAPGAAIGAGLGALAGSAAGYNGYSKNQDNIRGAILNFLPHSSFMLASTSPDYVWEGMRSVWEQTPAEPLAVLRPFIDLMMGQTAWGTEVKSEGFGDEMMKTLTGFIGVMAPPWIQKYGFKTTTPDVSFSDYVGQAGAAMGGAAIGAVGGGLLGGVPGAVAGGIAGGAFGAAGPDITNMSRLAQDTGNMIDPKTGKPGSPLFDFMLNNVGLWRSYPYAPETRLANEKKADKYLAESRNYLAQQLNSASQNQDEAKVAQIINKVYQSYQQQYSGNPAKAQMAFDKWMKGQLRTIGQLPSLREYSTSDLTDLYSRSGSFAADTRMEVFDQMTNTIKDELNVRSLTARQKAQNKRKEE